MMQHRIVQLLALCVLFCGVSVRAGTITGSVTDERGNPVVESLIYVDAIPDSRFDPPEEHVIVDQRNLMFYPHVLPVLVGTVVDFHNGDMLLHNVFSPDGCGDGFQLGTWPRGESRSYTFNDPCTAVILCNVHPEMEAYVVVVETPYFAFTDDEGHYKIEGVPAGDYTLKIWHERFRSETQSAIVAETTSVRRDFRFAR